jgi:signal transduction histidine kinase
MILNRFAEARARNTEGERGLTIRLKLTLWYGALFFLAGALLITVSFFLMRNGLSPAPGKAREKVAADFNIPSQLLERAPAYSFGEPKEGEERIYVSGVPLAELIDEAQQELRSEALRQEIMWSLMALGIMTVFTFGFSWLLAGRMLKPLHAITSTARRLSESTLHERIGLQGPRDELKELADTFDAMLARLDTAFAAQKEFVANASHELRTPLTIIRTEIDVALSDPDMSREDLEEMGKATTDAVDRSEHLIDGLLMLARADSSLTLSDVDLSTLAEDQVGATSKAADDMGLRLELDLQPAPMRGDRVLLERMVGNLVENAVRHNIPDGWFAVHTYQENGEAVVRIKNSGPIVSSEEVDKLFDRFYRPDKSRSRKTGGFGLGLSIVKSVATAHKGSVTIQALPDGGLDVSVKLPAAETAHDPATPETE